MLLGGDLERSSGFNTPVGLTEVRLGCAHIVWKKKLGIKLFLVGGSFCI